MDSCIFRWFYLQLGDPTHIIEKFLLQDYFQEHQKKFQKIKSGINNSNTFGYFYAQVQGIKLLNKIKIQYHYLGNVIYLSLPNIKGIVSTSLEVSLNRIPYTFRSSPNLCFRQHIIVNDNHKLVRVTINSLGKMIFHSDSIYGKGAKIEISPFNVAYVKNYGF